MHNITNKSTKTLSQSNKVVINFGNSYKTSDFIADTIEDWQADLNFKEKRDIKQIQFKVDNGPESGGVRTQFLNRMADFSKDIGLPIRLLYYPPYHS